MIKKLTKKFKGFFLNRAIKVLVWDFDGTIFKSKDLGRAYEMKYFDYSKKYSKNSNLTLKNFRSMTTLYGSWKDASSIITGHPGSSIANWVDSRIRKSDFIKPDRYIVKLINGLSKHKHIILSNAKGMEIVNGLKKIGFRNDKNTIHPFIKILSRDDGINKPDLRSFRKVTEITNLAAYRHLMIGDSLRDDIQPAKEFGFFAVHIDDALEMMPGWTKK